MVQLYSWLHSTFKEVSNDTSFAQIRVKTKNYGPDKLDKENYRDRENSVVKEKTLSRQSFLSQQRKLCRDRETLS